MILRNFVVDLVDPRSALCHLDWLASQLPRERIVERGSAFADQTYIRVRSDCLRYHGEVSSAHVWAVANSSHYYISQSSSAAMLMHAHSRDLASRHISSCSMQNVVDQSISHVLCGWFLCRLHTLVINEVVCREK